MAPTAEQLHRLARSSPWRWTTLRFTVRWPGSDEQPVRAWIRRPDQLRVERLDGALIMAGSQVDAPQARMLLTADGVQHGTAAAPWAGTAAVPTDADGLVLVRPAEPRVRYDDPMYRTYHWVAMLDPVELADGQADGRDAPGTAVDHVQAADHQGRLAWEASLRPTSAYQPRCSCCALLFSSESDALWGAEGATPAGEADPGFRYADAHRVRLDVQTGVCVLTEQLGGSRSGAGHELVIEAVDEPMPDSLFLTYPRARRIGRLLDRLGRGSMS